MGYPKNDGLIPFKWMILGVAPFQESLIWQHQQYQVRGPFRISKCSFSCASPQSTAVCVADDFPRLVVMKNGWFMDGLPHECTLLVGGFWEKTPLKNRSKVNWDDLKFPIFLGK